VAVGPDKTEKLVVNESRPEESSIFVSTITDNQVAALVQEKTIKAPAEAALRKVIDKKNEIAGVDQEIRSRQAEMESIDHDQARLRENMKALKGSAEEKTLLQRYTKQLDGQEDRLAELQKEIKEQRMKRAALQSQLDAMVEVLALDETL
jgi:predicted  nucleic acid-binding Zn-ribbon protein